MDAIFSRVDARYSLLYDSDMIGHVPYIDPATARTQPYRAIRIVPEPGRAHDMPPQFGLFHLHCNNTKRRAGRPVVYVECDGSLYPDGLVHLHTTSLVPTDFLSWSQFIDHIDAIGEFRITWLALPTRANEVPS